MGNITCFGEEKKDMFAKKSKTKSNFQKKKVERVTSLTTYIFSITSHFLINHMFDKKSNLRQKESIFVKTSDVGRKYKMLFKNITFLETKKLMFDKTNQPSQKTQTFNNTTSRCEKR